MPSTSGGKKVLAVIGVVVAVATILLSVAASLTTTGKWMGKQEVAQAAHEEKDPHLNTEEVNSLIDTRYDLKTGVILEKLDNLEEDIDQVLQRLPN